MRESGGWGESATDARSSTAIKLLARTEGIWTEPAGGTTLAVTKKLIEQGRIPRDESIVVSITGNGYKTLEAVARSVEKPFTIDATLDHFDDLFQQIESANAGLSNRQLESLTRFCQNRWRRSFTLQGSERRIIVNSPDEGEVI